MVPNGARIITPFYGARIVKEMRSTRSSLPKRDFRWTLRSSRVDWALAIFQRDVRVGTSAMGCLG